MFDFDFKLPKDRKSLIYFAISGGTLLLLLISLIYNMVSGTGAKPPAITPVNPLTSNSSESGGSSNVASSKGSSQPSSNSAQSGQSTSSTSSSTSQSSPPIGLKNIIIEAVLAGSENNDGESINSFTVNKAIEEKGLETIITEVVVAKFSDENMENMGHKGKQGLIDISLHLENKGSEAVSIKPEEITFTVNGKEYPLDKSAKLKNMTIEKGQKVETDTELTFVMPELENADAIKEISFNWQTTTGKNTQDYNVLLVLKNKAAET